MLVLTLMATLPSSRLAFYQLPKFQTHANRALRIKGLPLLRLKPNFKTTRLTTIG